MSTMNKPRYMTHVVESQAKMDVNGFRCWYCYQLIGNLHGKNCMAPASTAFDELGAAFLEEIERFSRWIHGKI